MQQKQYKDITQQRHIFFVHHMRKEGHHTLGNRESEQKEVEIDGNFCGKSQKRHVKE